MIDNNKRLENRVAARNKLNAEVNRIGQILIATFSPLVGQKVMKADGSIAKKYAQLIPIPSSNEFTIYRNPSNYTISFSVKVSYSVGEVCDYEYETIYVADLQDGLMVKRIYPFEQRRTDYRVTQVRQQREEVKALQQELDRAKKALYPFGESDC